MRRIFLLICLALTVTGCARIAQSNLNPMNWFGSSTVVRSDPIVRQRQPLIAQAPVAYADPRPLVLEVTELEVERTAYGALVRATGMTRADGYYNVQLTEEGYEGGTLVYAFRASPAPAPQQPGTPQTRRVTVARDLSARDLAGVSAIRVVAAGNARVTSR
ncbi:lipoprotein [Pelagovum pacificum]|uniref:Lipoprotein n=1 Tax=Pelagovum pacificum TaxID=2588711 RepID=A0A5C5GGE7_9RHOB|nr:lipoprotein [Pelagovum pacificum]QQA44272.1 hypothetical protein I8N54_06750 [Pelagovum pacificum]TNY32606.1 hypothetical protein FHY64_04815 [Pelagovum pacificum]